MKRCPFCAEEIQDAATKCRYCGSVLAPQETPLPAGPPADALPRKEVKAQSPALAVGSLIVFAGLWLLFMGISEYYGGASTRQMYNGTILEQNADMNRIASNAMSAGRTKVVFGIVALLLGGVIAARGKASTAENRTTPPALAGPPQNMTQ